MQHQRILVVIFSPDSLDRLEIKYKCISQMHSIGLQDEYFAIASAALSTVQ